VQNVSKSFRIYHEKRNSIYEIITGFFKRKKYYETLPVLDNISFSLQSGEMLGILGRNGVGKTTLLRIISGIYKPDSGKIIKSGTIIPFLALGSGFQPELTARSNVILYGVLLGMTRKEITNKVDEIIKFAELEKFADIKLKNFSAGMYARLAFSTAVQVDPDIMLMDEILSVGDLSFQKKSFDKFLEFKKRGKSIILVTHSMDPIKEYCDRAILIDKGKILASGKPDEVVAEYEKISYKE
jgi:lipopolysaccharide transport system ATP-binding protein